MAATERVANDDQADGMAGPETGAKLALGYDGHRLAIGVRWRNGLIERAATERDLRFHGVLSFRNPALQAEEDVGEGWLTGQSWRILTAQRCRDVPAT